MFPLFSEYIEFLFEFGNSLIKYIVAIMELEYWLQPKQYKIF